MMKMNPTLIRKLFYFFCLLGVACLVFALAGITYATVENVEPNVLIRINGEGEVTCSGNLFGGELWYPGREEHGIIRVSSEIGARLSSLGFDISLKQYQPLYSRDTVYQSFLDHMKLTVKKGSFLVFTSTLLDKASLSSIVVNDGIFLDTSDQIRLPLGESIDLQYTLKMDEESGEELEDVTASVAFKINLEQN